MLDVFSLLGKTYFLIIFFFKILLSSSSCSISKAFCSYSSVKRLTLLSHWGTEPQTCLEERVNLKCCMGHWILHRSLHWHMLLHIDLATGCCTGPGPWSISLWTLVPKDLFRGMSTEQGKARMGLVPNTLLQEEVNLLWWDWASSPYLGQVCCTPIP